MAAVVATLACLTLTPAALTATRQSPVVTAHELFARAPAARCVATAAPSAQSFKTRNPAARAILEKLSRLRTSRTAPVDVEGLGRVIRGAELNDATLLEVLLGLKAAGNWQVSLALATMLEAQAPLPPPQPPQGKQRGGRRRGAIAAPAAAPAAPSGEEGLTMADLLGGADATPPRTAGALQTIHYNVLISSCAKARRWKDAMDLHGRMQARGVEQTTITYNTLLHVLEKVNGRGRGSA